MFATSFDDDAGFADRVDPVNFQRRSPSLGDCM
jgi:hypothetical protein